MAGSTTPLTLGTAGHIDHGKTALIAALTGRDTDRLPEERRRGISIELGYAPLILPGGRQLSVVDVPGHGPFVRSVQVHDEAVERAAAGQRVALNLAGVGWREVGRGDVVVAGEGVRPGYLLDVDLATEEGTRPLERGTRVQVHHGTREAPARVVP